VVRAKTKMHLLVRVSRYKKQFHNQKRIILKKQQQYSICPVGKETSQQRPEDVQTGRGANQKTIQLLMLHCA